MTRTPARPFRSREWFDAPGRSDMAALYLERFVPAAQKWAHLDVYAWNDSDRPGKPAGGEAQGLRAAFAMLQARYSA